MLPAITLMSMVNSMLYFNPQFRAAALHHATTAFNFTLASSLKNCSSYNRSTIMINFADYDSSERWLMNGGPAYAHVHGVRCCQFLDGWFCL